MRTVLLEWRACVSGGMCPILFSFFLVVFRTVTIVSYLRADLQLVSTLPRRWVCIYGLWYHRAARVARKEPFHGCESVDLYHVIKYQHLHVRTFHTRWVRHYVKKSSGNLGPDDFLSRKITPVDGACPACMQCTTGVRHDSASCVWREAQPLGGADRLLPWWCLR